MSDDYHDMLSKQNHLLQRIRSTKAAEHLAKKAKARLGKPESTARTPEASRAEWKYETSVAENRAKTVHSALTDKMPGVDPGPQRAHKILALERRTGSPLRDTVPLAKVKRTHQLTTEAGKATRASGSRLPLGRGLDRGRFEAHRARTNYIMSHPYISSKSEFASSKAEFEDLGEKTPGAGKAQAARAREIAKSLREKRSSVTRPAAPVSEKPWTPRGAVATSSGPEAGATTLKGRVKDLGRIAAKVIKGTYGEVSQKTVAKVQSAHAERSISSLAGKAGKLLGVAGLPSQVREFKKQMTPTDTREIEVITSSGKKEKRKLSQYPNPITGKKSGVEA